MSHTMINKARNRAVRRGDAVLVTRMALARKLNGGKGFSQSYVQKVLTGERRNAQITALHQQLIRIHDSLIKP